MKKILTSITLISLACSTFSQGHNEQVTVIAPYQPILMGQAYKINVSPQTIDSALIPREARFDIFSRKVPTTFGIDNIRPARVAGEPISKLSPLYVRAGGGNYGTAYGELFFGSLRSAKWNYGTHLKHRSSQGKFKDHEVPYDNSENYARIFGDYYAKKVLLSADFYYDRKRVSAYGALPLFLDSNSNFIDDKLYKRVYQNIGGNIGFSDNNTELSGWKYSGNLAMNWFQSAPSIDEFSLAFDGNIHQTFDFGHYIFNQTVVGLDVSVDLDGLNDVLSHRTSADDPGFTGNKNMKMFKFHPYGKLRFSGHDFSLGLRVNIFDEPGDTNFINDLPVFPDKKIRLKTAAQFVPTVQLKFNLIDNLLAIEFGMDGNVEYLTTRKIAKRNLFLSPSFFPYDIYTTAPLYRAELYREYYLGLNTMLSKRLDFSLKGAIINYKNLLNFESTYFEYIEDLSLKSFDVPTPFFEPFYENKIGCIQIQADLNYHLDEKISVSAMARYNHYDEPIIYKPNFESNLTARYNMQDKIILKTQLYIETGRYYQLTDYGYATDEKFEPIIDWSLGAEYRYDRRWGAFLELNNILNQKRYQWVNYRLYGLNFMAGITFNL